MSINPLYLLGEATTSFRRNWIMSLGAIITIFLSLLLVGVSIYSGAVVNSLVEDVESKVSIQVFILDDAPSQDIEVLQRQLQSNPLVSTVSFTTKDEALEKFKETMEQSPEVIANIEGNPLPASLDVELNNAQDIELVVEEIKASDAFMRIADRPDDPSRSLNYGQETVRRLFAFTNVLRYIGIAFVAMLALVSLIFINNTIRLAIYARRAEIGIMRLVGASNWFIRAPFILEGVFQALIGALLAIATLFAFHVWGLPRIQQAISFMAISVPNAIMWQIAALLTLGGILIGIIGSWIAMRKYLKV
ncbi:MAG: permease-like cell division protein FtsX [Coriobacteriia bacterium]|nr:permease-like cell division protein FtsX [Coriobacteriia bacterium]